ncbi:Lon family ATP-dependent protease [Nitzschia inconspicua]|uniref:Lon family ATP-dependent protease n=1 Tax=Nitzschia inconspicua TaxID=303405 RepID=A0A9K3KDD6_9STRA|nr:Lon family ATP-dependent protease [Nitzschia inconspicua]
MRGRCIVPLIVVAASSLILPDWKISAFVHTVIVNHHRDGTGTQQQQQYHLSQSLHRSPQKSLPFVGTVASRTSLSRRWLAADDDEDDDDDDYDEEEEEEKKGPLSKGIDSVSWLPSVIGAKGDNVPITSAKKGNEILPLFPLGGFVYTPNTEHVLNIFEPRYRQMYTDILMNGSKRFVVVTSHPTEQGRFAQTGVLFELEDLKEVSEQTKDQIKYICNHKVTGRVTIHRVLNPEAWETRNTYLKIEGTIHDDSGKTAEGETSSSSEMLDRAGAVYGAVVEAATTKEENDLIKTFQELVNLQHELDEDVRFTKTAAASLAVKDGPGNDGLWQTIRLWQSFIEQRLLSRQNELQQEFQDKLKAFLKKEKGLKNDQLPSAIGFGDLSPELQRELQELQKRMAVELQPLVLESSLTMQKILEADGHAARCRLLKYFMTAELERLTTKKSLQGVFSSKGGSSDASLESSSFIPPEEMITDDDMKSAEKKSPTFYDEPDAFQ